MNILITGGAGFIGSHVVKHFLTDNNAIDYCVNAAAYANVDQAEEKKEVAFMLNETAPSLLVEACKQHKVFLLNKIIKSAFASSIEDFSDGISMSWYDLAMQLTAVEIKEKAVATLKLKVKRPKNTALLNNLNE